MDYLLRDSHHLGVAYGIFDHERLIRMLRLVPHSPGGGPLSIGMDEGGIHAAEALLNARYFMFMQVYYHRARVAYDQHLGAFLRTWLPEGQFPTELSEHQQLTDNEVSTAIARAASEQDSNGYIHANAIMRRDHFRQLFLAREYDTDPKHRIVAINELEAKARDRYGDDVFTVEKPIKFTASQVKVGRDDGTVVMFDNLSDMPPARLKCTLRFILVNPKLTRDAMRWIRSARKQVGLNDSE